MAETSRRYTATHEWVELAEGTATVGISDHAQAQLGDVIFLELPPVGTRLEAGERFGTIESVKAASDLYSPVGGEVIETNEALGEAPETVNTDPYGAGWLIRLGEVVEGTTELLDQAAYERTIQS